MHPSLTGLRVSQPAPNVGKDADDTAKGIISLTMLASSSNAQEKHVQSASLTEAMIKNFEVESHFQTYESERDPSFSANCNVLQALLYQSDPSLYQVQIWKVAEFLSNSWWESHGAPEDKWVSCFLLTQIAHLLIQGVWC